MSKPERLTASISSETDGVLDLQEGFLKAIKLRIHNRESEPIRFSCQFFKEAESGNEDALKGTVIFDLARALRLGMLEITEEDRSTIPFDYTGDLELAPLVKDAWDIEANDGKAFQFGRVNTKVLQLFRRHLNPGKTYHLRLCGQTLQIFCMYDEEYIDAILSGCEDPWGLSTENRVRPACDPQLVTFTVVAGTRKPNFTISIKAFSPFCSGLRPKMKISMCNTSLERRPAKVKLDLHGFANVRPQDSLFRWRRWGSHDLFSLLNESQKEAGLLNMKSP